MPVDYENRLNKGYMLQRSPRLFQHAAAYLYSREIENVQLGDENTESDNWLIRHSHPLNNVLKRRGKPHTTKKCFSNGLQDILKNCQMDEYDFEFNVRDYDPQIDELCENEYIMLAIVEMKTKLHLDADVDLDDLNGVSCFIEHSRLNRNEKHVTKGVYSTAFCKKRIVMLFELFDPKIHILKNVMLMKVGADPFAKLAAVMEEMKSAMNDDEEIADITNSQLYGYFKSYCELNNKQELFERLSEKFEKVKDERSNYLIMTTHYIHTNDELKFYFKEVRTIVENGDSWLKFNNTFLHGKCALFEYLWFYGALPVQPIADPARVFYKGADGYYYSRQTLMRADGTIYWRDEDDIIRYELVGNKLRRL